MAAFRPRPKPCLPALATHNVSRHASNRHGCDDNGAGKTRLSACDVSDKTSEGAEKLWTYRVMSSYTRRVFITNRRNALTAFPQNRNRNVTF